MQGYTARGYKEPAAAAVHKQVVRPEEAANSRLVAVVVRTVAVGHIAAAVHIAAVAVQATGSRHSGDKEQETECCVVCLAAEVQGTASSGPAVVAPEQPMRRRQRGEQREAYRWKMALSGRSRLYDCGRKG